MLLSIYAFYIEKRVEENKKYKALCDISDKASCTKAFSSSYGKMFIIPNSLMGIIFYAVIIILALLNQTNSIFYLSILSLLITLYLAYILFIKLKNICIVCSLIYAVNILLVIFAYVGR